MLHLCKLQIAHQGQTVVEHPPLPQEKPMIPFHRDGLASLVLMQRVEELSYNDRDAEMWRKKREFSYGDQMEECLTSRTVPENTELLTPKSYFPNLMFSPAF